MIEKADIKNEKRNASLKTYVIIWGLLIVLTGITLTTADLNLGGITIIVCLAIAAVKSTLVLLFFMHLLYEKRKVIRLTVPIAITVLAVFIILTYSDVLTR